MTGCRRIERGDGRRTTPAMAALGKPMISFEVGTGTSFVNADGGTAFVLAPESPESLADAMNRLLKDAVLAARMAVAARARYERLFLGEALGREYAKLFREVAGYVV